MSDDKKSGERIAKVMARAGISSRRDAEKMILDGRVSVNGVKATTPALDVLPTDKVTLDGKPIDAPQPARLWLYYKPLGLVTSNKDEKGRQTVFDTMPADMPRVMSIGRLDLNSEGLLLLTNDGDLKRKLELPSTGWLRKYRVRVNGRPNDATFDPLRRGVTVEGEEFQPMDITLDRQKGANAWLTVGLREGKNREIRRAMTEVGMIVNRLIRVSYGPFRLNLMKEGDVVEVKQRVLRDQLGSGVTDDAADTSGTATRKPRAPRPGGAAGGRPFKPRDGDGPRDRADFKPRGPRRDGDATGDRPFKPRAKPEGAGDRKDFKPRGPRREGDAAGDRPFKPRAKPEGAGDRKDFKPRGPRREGDAAGDRPFKPRAKPEGAGDRKDFKPRGTPTGTGPRKDGKPRPAGAGPRKGGPTGRK
ncbi:MAG: pseudouridine synthase [Albidovulum sp.]